MQPDRFTAEMSILDSLIHLSLIENGECTATLLVDDDHTFLGCQSVRNGSHPIVSPHWIIRLWQLNDAVAWQA